MKKLISLLGSLIIVITGYYIFLNIYYQEEYSIEKSIKLLKKSFIENPIKISLLSLVFILLGLIAGYLINKFWSLITERQIIEKSKIQTNVERTKKIVEIRNQFFEKVFLKFDNPMDFPPNPMYRIKGDFKEVNIKDINDHNFPYSGYMSKYETFDFVDEGIELLGGGNILGFNLQIKNNETWDVVSRFDKLKKGHYHKPTSAYEIFFLSYEDIFHIDWDKDPIEGNITISCHFRYKSFHKHPFKEFRYYVESGYGLFYQLDPNRRRNFAQFSLLKPIRIYISTIRNNITNRQMNSKKSLWM